MARIESANINHCVLTRKDSIPRHDEIKTEFTAREGTYKVSSFIDTLGRLASNTCLNEPVKITLRSRIQTIVDDGTRGNILLTDVLAYNVGRELLVYEFTEAIQVEIELR